MSTDSDTTELDVIIPTKDRPEQLDVTLRALGAQRFSDFGVIVVDDGGAEVAESLVAPELVAALRIRFVRNPISIGPGAARNRGVSQTSANYVVFLDDDCVPAPQLLERHHAVLSSAAGPIVSLGPILSPAGKRLPVWAQWDADRMERGYRDLASGRARPSWADMFTGNVGLRRADFLAVGGFDERFARGEDVELGHRLAEYGCRFEFDSDCVVRHHNQRSLRGWLRIASSTAQFDAEWDRLAPQTARLSSIERQLRDKHWALRLTRRILRGPVAQRCGIVLAMGAGFLLHALRADRLALPAVSVARDLIYCRALQDATLTTSRLSDAA